MNKPSKADFPLLGNPNAQHRREEGDLARDRTGPVTLLIPQAAVAEPLRPQLLMGLFLLIQAWDCARDLQRPLWDFAVPVAHLQGAGLTNAELLWLVYQDHVQHALETTKPGMGSRAFDRPGGLDFPERTCFVLTETGRAFALVVGAARAQPQPPNSEGNGLSGHDPASRPIPSWDKNLRELHFRGKLVRHFARSAPHQELILAVFEEEGWPPRIDNPISPPPGGGDAGDSLHDAVIRLNRNQVVPVLRFHCIAAGTGAWWGPLPATDTGSPPDQHPIDT